MIIVSTTLLSKIESHGELTYPEECCGAILGTFDASSNKKIINEVIEIDNISNEDKKRRFMIKPEEYQRVESYAKEKSLILLGFYHSHPDHPATPSDTDLKFAWPFFSYLITTVNKSQAKETNSFVIDLESNVFKNETLTIVDK